MTREHYITLLSWFGAHTQGLGTVLCEYGTPAALFAADWQDERGSEQFAALPGATQRLLLSVRRQWPRRNPKAPLRAAFEAPALGSANTQQPGLDAFIPLTDPRYPPALRDIPDPPPWLFCRGDPGCLQRPVVAMVGSRRASHAGLQAAELISQRLAGAGYTVCSGLALGIDAAAHRGALQAGQTVAVLASGVDRASPHSNRQLAEDICRTGCLLSELPATTAPSKYQFPRRNRIISGLAQATIIVEAALPSGSLHTAAAALEQGREVFTLPWSIFHEQGAGCRRLIRDGATPITALEELSELFPGVAGDPFSSSQRLSGAAGRLLELLGDEGLPLPVLAQALNMAIPDLLALLGELELQGCLRNIDGRYCRHDYKPCHA
ncbi:MAG: DNA-processing protein DprA [Congregibacter sp.]|nr:DNA-processing protein DprA [Congregibacter sp.]